MVGPLIRMNSGGSPGKGSGAAPVSPVLPKPADTAPIGEKTGKANINPQLPLASLGDLGPQQLIVDVWGDPALGRHVQLLDPEGDA